MRAGNAGVALLLRHLEIIVVEADRAEGERHAEHDPDIGIGRIGPQHGRRASRRTGSSARPWSGVPSFLVAMRLRAVLADRLAAALLQPQQVDDRRAGQKHEDQRRDRRAAGAERDVAENIERGESCPRIRSANTACQPCARERLPSSAAASAAGKARSSALTIGAHPRAVRALDHDGIAGPDGVDHLRLRDPSRFRHSRPGVRREGPATGCAWPGPEQKTRSMRIVDDRIDQFARAGRPTYPRVPACRRARRCGVRAGRPGDWPSKASAARMETGLAL